MGPARFHCATLLPVMAGNKLCHFVQRDPEAPAKNKVGGKILLSEVGFEPTPSEEDCDLNAAP